MVVCLWGVLLKNLVWEPLSCDLKKQNDKLLKFCCDSDNHELMKNRKTLHEAKNEDRGRVLIEWIQQQRSKDTSLTGLLVMKQARIYHEEQYIEGEYEYSEAWLQKFKKWYGIKYLKICGEKASADHETVENYIDKFAKNMMKTLALNTFTRLMKQFCSGAAFLEKP